MHFTGKVLSTRGLSDSGYPVVCIDGKTPYVHDLVARTYIGPKPAGMVVCHRNDVPVDNNPANLRYDTHQQNTLDIFRNGNHASQRQTECAQGHLYDESNTYRNAKGHRMCRTCRREWRLTGRMKADLQQMCVLKSS